MQIDDYIEPILKFHREQMPRRLNSTWPVVYLGISSPKVLWTFDSFLKRIAELKEPVAVRSDTCPNQLRVLQYYRLELLSFSSQGWFVYASAIDLMDRPRDHYGLLGRILVGFNRFALLASHFGGVTGAADIRVGLRSATGFELDLNGARACLDDVVTYRDNISLPDHLSRIGAIHHRIGRFLLGHFGGYHLDRQAADEAFDQVHRQYALRHIHRG